MSQRKVRIYNYDMLTFQYTEGTECDYWGGKPQMTHEGHKEKVKNTTLLF